MIALGNIPAKTLRVKNANVPEVHKNALRSFPWKFNTNDTTKNTTAITANINPM